MDDGEGEFAFRNILTEALVLSVGFWPEIKIVIFDLEDDSQ